MKKLSLSRGFSLTELLVTIGILAIVGSVATVLVTSYTKTARERTLSRALSKVVSSFNTCMAFNGFKGSECHTFEQIKYELSSKHRPRLFSDQDKENICFELVTIGRGKTRGCVQFENGSLKRKCLLEKPGFRPRCDKTNKGICCANCYGDCEEGKGAKEPEPS